MTQDMSAFKNFETKAIHVGQEPDPTTGAVIPPIYQTTTYRQPAIDELGEYEYSRGENPTRTALQDVLASLENGAWALSFSSGMAATTNATSLLKPGDHVILSNDAYGGSYRLFAKVLQPWGIETSQVDLSNLDNVRAALRPNTKMVWVESPTNPYLHIVDIAGIAELIKGTDAIQVVDNTFASPYLQNPLALGAELVMHSTTKYLGGHSDVIGGALIGNDTEMHEKLKFNQMTTGGVPSPFDCWLTLRGIKTLAVRMRQHNESAMKIAQYLEAHPNVEKVFYPGLPSHPGHELASKQMRGYSGMISFNLKGGFDAAKAMADKINIFTLAVSLGGVESLIEYPPAMTHAAVIGTTAEVDPGLLRMSVGIEHVDDLIADLEQAIG